MSEDTGNLALIVFPISGFSARFEQIGEVEQSVEKIHVDALDSTGKEYVRGDLVEPGEIELVFYFDTEATPPEPGTVDTPIVTFPTRDGEATPASYTASGFFLTRLMPQFKNGQLQSGKAKFAFDNKSIPFAFTPAVAS